MTIDVDQLKAGVDIVAVVGQYVKLRRSGSEHAGLCPFHAESSPSFTVNAKKGFVHCFGCGAHHDVIGFVQAITGADFHGACAQLGARDFEAARDGVRREVDAPLECKWVALMPVPEDAPELMADGDWTVPLWNPKAPRYEGGELVGHGKLTRLKPTRVDAYRRADGALLGYVLRCDFLDRDTGKPRKWTPQVTWCVGEDGKRQWCLQAFPDPRPLYGLDALVEKPDAPVLIPEGEKCRAAGAGAWPQYAVVAWPGGSNGMGKVDWSPLTGRDVVLWPDADGAGRKAMLGARNDAGDVTPGVAMYAARAGARSIRYIDTEGMPKGWDIADALQDGWTPRQLAAWAATRVIDVTVLPG